MPKRRRDKREEVDYDEIVKKIRKLERKVKHARRHDGHRQHRSRSLSKSDTQSPHNSPERSQIASVADNYYEDSLIYSPGHSSWYNYPESVNDTPRGMTSQVVVAEVHPPPAGTPRPPARSADARPLNSASFDEAEADALISIQGADSLAKATSKDNTDNVLKTSDPTAQSNELEQVVEIDSDLLDILGEDPTNSREYGPDSQDDLAKRLKHIATTGLSKDTRKEIKEKYLIPGNCKLIKAPSLNPEIRASLVESQTKRDKGIENKQNMTSYALSSLSTALTMLFKAEEKNPELKPALKILMDTARILSDIQHSDSKLRRYFILSTVKKELKEQLDKTLIDEMLFGSNLVDTLKSAKYISKPGAEIRNSQAAAKPQSVYKTPSRPLNYRHPPASRRGVGVPAAAGRSARPPPPPPPAPRPTTTRPTHTSAFRTSSRQPPVRHRR